jgi:hypothetical protein
MGTNSRNFPHRALALISGISGGLHGVSVDADHIICAILANIPLLPIENLFGCKIWHDSILLVAGVVFGVVVALYIGLVGSLVYNAIRTTFEN